MVHHLHRCRTKDVPQHAESTRIIISGEFVDPYRQILLERIKDMAPPQARHINKFLKKPA